MATIHIKVLKGNTAAGDTIANEKIGQADNESGESSSEVELKKLRLPFYPNNYGKAEECAGDLEKASRSVTLRTPWIPAPGRTSHHTTINLNPLRSHSNTSKENLKGTSSVVSVASSPRRKRLSRANRQNAVERSNFPKSRVTGTKLKSRRSPKETTYTLRSKDSLIDVTACLNEKREQLMKLWQENLPSSNAYLLDLLEKTNNLALEATEDLGKLRNSIQSLQKKSSLTDTDSAYLDSLRNSVMDKLNAFEESNGKINNLIGAPSPRQNNEDVISMSKYSQTSMGSKGENRSSRSRSTISRTKSVSSQSQTDIVFLKTKAEHFYEHDTGNDTNVLASESNSNSAVKSCDSSSQVDYSCLNNLYNEQYVLPTVKESYTAGPRKDDNMAQSHERIHRVVRFQDNHEENDRFYKEKLTELQRKIASQESDVSDLRTELTRIESQSRFQMKLLKTNIKDKLEELEVIPELLQLTEHQLGGTIQSRILMEQSLHEKDRDLNSARGDMQKTLVELIDTKEKLKRSEIMNNSLGFQLQEVLKENDRLKSELENCHKSYSQKIEDKAKENCNLSYQLDHALKNQTSILVDDSGMTKENIKLADKVLELEKDLARAERDIRLQRKSKAKLSTRMNRRVEELMENLEESRRRNRHLISQIQLIKTSYYKLFPVELFFPKSGENLTEKVTWEEISLRFNNDTNFQQANVENRKNSPKEQSTNLDLRSNPDDDPPLRLGSSVPSSGNLAVKRVEKKRVLFESPTNRKSTIPELNTRTSDDSTSDSESYSYL